MNSYLFRLLFSLGIVVALVHCQVAQLQAQQRENDVDLGALVDRLQAAEQRILELESAKRAAKAKTAVPPVRQTEWTPNSFEATQAGLLSTDDCSDCPDFYTDYDGGFVIRPYDKEATPFELQINGRMQFRYQGFHRDITTFDNLGGAVPVEHRNDFEIERARLEFKGFFYDPNLQFFLNIDGDTDDNHRVIFHDFWVNYVFSDAFNLHVGKAFVPGSREWLNGSTGTHLADRTMATTFFRPDRSVGVWATGEVREGLFYRVMLGNGFNVTDLERTGFLIDDQLFYSASKWWEPLGEFGKPGADLEWHDSPVVRVGHSFSYGEQDPMNGATTLEQQRAARLSDGTRLTDVDITEFDLYLYAVDLSAKYRGWSMNAEYYFRWLQDLQSAGAFSHTELYQDGFALDVGCMLIEKKLELVGRTSFVDGIFKDSWEYAGGVNWYINGTHKHKITLDVSVLDGSPAVNAGPGFEIGMDGLFYRMQYQAAF